MNKYLILFAAIVLMLFGFNGQTAEFTVTTTEDTIDASLADGLCLDSNGECSLRAAIMQSNILGTDEVIFLPRGQVSKLQLVDDIDTQNVNDLDIWDSVTVSIADPELPIVSLDEIPMVVVDVEGSVEDRVFEIHDGELIVFNGLYIANGNAGNSLSNERQGGGVYISDQVHEFQLRDSVVALNQAGFGAGVYSLAEITVIESSDISYNTVNVPAIITLGAGGAGIYHAGMQMTLSKSSVHHNYIDSFGFFVGAIHLRGIDSQVNIVNTLVGENGFLPMADSRTVSGIRADQANVTINNSNISGNGSVGIEFNTDDEHTLVIRNTVLTLNLLDNCGDLEGDIDFGNIMSIAKIMSSDDSCDLPGSAGNLESINPNFLSAIQGRFESGDLQFFSYQFPVLDDSSVLIDNGSSLDVNSNEISACETDDFRGVSRPVYGFYANLCDVGMYESNDLIYRNGFDST